MSARPTRLAIQQCRQILAKLRPQATPRTFIYPRTFGSHYSTSRHYNVWVTLQPGETGYGLWTPHVLGVLLAMGVGLTTWATLPSLDMWPPDVRNDIRRGVHAKERGDWTRCRLHLSRAYRALVSVPQASISPDAFLKTSGLLMTLADALEESEQPLQAYWTYMLAIITARSEVTLFPDSSIQRALKESGLLFDQTTNAGAPSPVPIHRIKVEPTLPNRLRLISILLKLSDMAPSLNIDAVEERRILILAINLAKKIIDEMVAAKKSPAKPVDNVSSLSRNSERDDLELPLPVWAKGTAIRDLSSVDAMYVVAPYERMAKLYARVGLIEQAIMHYNHVNILINILGNDDVSLRCINSCRVAQMTCNMAEVLVDLHEQFQFSEVSPQSRFPPLPAIANQLNLPEVSFTINNEPLTPDNILQYALLFAFDAFKASSEFMFVARTGRDSKGASRDLDNYGHCANVMVESLKQMCKIYELNGNKDYAKDTYNILLDFAKGYSFAEYTSLAKDKLVRIEDENRMEGRRKVGKLRTDLEYDQVD